MTGVATVLGVKKCGEKSKYKSFVNVLLGKYDLMEGVTDGDIKVGTKYLDRDYSEVLSVGDHVEVDYAVFSNGSLNITAMRKYVESVDFT